MKRTQQHNSEVARLLQKIREEFESAQLGLSGVAYGTSQHKVITQKMENMGKYHEELRGIVGDNAIELIVQVLSDSPDTTHSSSHTNLRLERQS